MGKKLGQLEMLFFSYAQMRKLRTVRTGDMVRALDITPKQERELLSRMAKTMLIAQVRRGLYLVPPQLPLGGKWTPEEILAINTLMDDQDGCYQMCGPNAFNRYGFDEQIPNRLYAYNNRLSGDRAVGVVQLTLIKVSDKRLGDTDCFKTPDGLTAVYSSRVRTMVDAVYDWSRFNGLPRAYRWIREDLSAGRVTARELVRCAVRFGNQGTMRRIGALLEKEGVAGSLLCPLRRALTSSKSLIPLVPNRPVRGAMNRRWGVILNEQE